MIPEELIPGQRLVGISSGRHYTFLGTRDDDRYIINKPTLYALRPDKSHRVAAYTKREVKKYFELITEQEGC